MLLSTITIAVATLLYVRNSVSTKIAKLPEWYEQELDGDELETSRVDFEPLPPRLRETKPEKPRLTARPASEPSAKAPDSPRRRKTSPSGSKSGKKSSRRPAAAKTSKATQDRFAIRNPHRQGPWAKQRVTRIVKSSRIKLHNEHLDLGIIVDPKRIPWEKISNSRKQAIQSAASAMGLSLDAPLSLSLRDHLQREGETLKVSPNFQLFVGEMKVPTQRIESLLGLHRNQIRRILDRELERIRSGLPSGR